MPKTSLSQNNTSTSSKINTIKTKPLPPIITREEKTKRRTMPGTRANREVNYWQKGEGKTKQILRNKRISNIVHEMISDFSIKNQSARVEKKAVEAILQAAESFCTDLFFESENNRKSARRKTTTVDDIGLAANKLIKPLYRIPYSISEPESKTKRKRSRKSH
jgi:histone H3/H4